MIGYFGSNFLSKYLAALMLVAGLVACGGGGGDDEDIQLPTGVTITSQPLAGDHEAVDERIDTNNYVRITLVFENTTDKALTVTIPACFTFVDTSGKNQDGLSIWRREIKVPANSTYRLMLGTYCMNSNRPAPSGGIAYELGGKADSKALRKLCDILKKKVLSRHSSIQTIVWNITNGEELSDEDIATLEHLEVDKSGPAAEVGAPDKAALLKQWLAARQ